MPGRGLFTGCIRKLWGSWTRHSQLAEYFGLRASVPPCERVSAPDVYPAKCPIRKGRDRITMGGPQFDLIPALQDPYAPRLRRCCGRPLARAG
jgi:hypothetical protein